MGRGTSEEVRTELRSECLAILQSHIRRDKCVESTRVMFTEVLSLVHSNERREGVRRGVVVCIGQARKEQLKFLTPQIAALSVFL